MHDRRTPATTRGLLEEEERAITIVPFRGFVVFFLLLLFEVSFF